MSSVHRQGVARDAVSPYEGLDWREISDDQTDRSSAGMTITEGRNGTSIGFDYRIAITECDAATNPVDLDGWACGEHQKN